MRNLIPFDQRPGAQPPWALILIEGLVRAAGGGVIAPSRTAFRADRFRLTRALRRKAGPR